jgi:hypothetical protein
MLSNPVDFITSRQRMAIGDAVIARRLLIDAKPCVKTDAHA